MSIPGAGSPLFLSAAAAPAAAFQIDRSLRFNSGDTSSLSKTFSSAGNRKTWTWSCWYKRSVLGTKNQKFFSCLTGSNDNTYLELRSFNDDTICLSGYATNFRITDAEIRDPSAWYHLVVACDTTQGSNSDRVKLYINGVQQTFRTEATIIQNADLGFNQAEAHQIGNSFDGYLAEIHFVDGGTQLAASDFGEYDSNNVWQPKDCKDNLTYGTNGFYLKFADNSSNSALGTDSSGNNNTWTVNNISVAGPSVTTTGNISLGSSNRSFYFKGQSGHSLTVVAGCFVWDSSDGNTWTYRGQSGTTVTLTSAYVELSGTTSVSFTNTNSDTVVYWSLPIGTGLPNSSGTTATFNVEAYGEEVIDSLIDTPTNYTADSGNNGGNYATLNPLQAGSQCTLSNGNLDLVWSGSTGHAAGSTIAVSSGKWYMEFTVGSKRGLIGIIPSTYASKLNIWPGNSTYGSNSYGYYGIGGLLYNNGNGNSYGAGWTTGDIIGVALDLDAGNLVFYKNGSSQGTAATGLSGSYIFAIGFSDFSSGGDPGSVNFGQRRFAYTPPTNHLSLCTTNLADPTIADGSTAMNATTYTGNGSTQAVTGLNHSPDFAWIKHRTRSQSHVIYDIVRGAGTGKSLSSNSSGAEGDASDGTVYGYLNAFGSDGFTVIDGSDAEDYVNKSGAPYIAWTWDGGSSTVSNSDGSITSNVRANASAGFSVVGYQGTGTAATIGHGLNAAPEFIIVKNRDTARPWSVFHQSITGMSSGYLNLNLINAFAGSYTGVWNGTDPTNSVFSVGTDNESNNSGDDFIAYCWTPVSQYSAFGLYVGNGSSDGPFIFTGFRPRWILIKDIGGAINWRLLDTARNTFNLAENGLHPNTAGVENTTNMAMDILSNGFKIKATADINASGNNHIYAAFAEHPFKTSRAR